MAAEGQEYLVATFRRSGSTVPIALSVNIAAITTNYLAIDERTSQTFINIKQPCQLTDLVTDAAATNHYTIKIVMNGAETGKTLMSKALSPAVSPRIVPIDISAGILQLKFYQPA